MNLTKAVLTAVVILGAPLFSVAAPPGEGVVSGKVRLSGTLSQIQTSRPRERTGLRQNARLQSALSRKRGHRSGQFTPQCCCLCFRGRRGHSPHSVHTGDFRPAGLPLHYPRPGLSHGPGGEDCQQRSHLPQHPPARQNQSRVEQTSAARNTSVLLRLRP